MWAHALKRWENDLARLRMSLCFKHSAYHAATWSEQKVVSGCCLRFLLEASVCRCQEVQEYPCLLRCLLGSPSVQLLSEHVHACLSSEVFSVLMCSYLCMCRCVCVRWWRGRNISGKMVRTAFWHVPVFIFRVSYVIYIQHRLTDSLFLQIMQGVRGYNNRMAMFQFKKLNAEKIKIHSNSWLYGAACSEIL